MRKILFLGLPIFLLTGFGMALAQDDVKRFPSCFYCGMDRVKFAHSRMHLEYDDGSALGTCSLRCAAVDMALFTDKAPINMKVGDYKTKKLVDAEKAYWVIGGDKMGVMTKRAKWAFEKEQAAKDFIQKHGGEAADFEQVMEAAYEDMYKDTKMIREKRKKMRMMKKKKKS